MNRLPLILTGSILLVISLGVRAHGNQDPSQGDRTGKRNAVEQEGILQGYMETLAEGVDLIEMEKARSRGHKQFKPKRNRRGGGQRGNGDK